ELRKQSKRREEEQLLIDIYKGISQSIFVVDVLENGEFRYVSLNPQHEKITGVSTDFIKGKKPEDVLPKEAALNVRKRYAECVSLKQTIFYEEWLPFKGRQTCWETILNPRINESGKVYQIIGTSQDITERKHSEDRVVELKEFNESIVSNLAEGIILENDNGIIQFANPALLRMLGYKEGELLGKHWNCFVPDDQIEAVKNANQRREKGESDEYEMQLVRKDGERIFVLVRGTPNVNKGKYIGLLATFTDITERKQAEKELAQTFELFSNLASLVPGVLYQYRLYPDGSSAFPYSSPGMNAIYEVTPEQVREDATPVFGRLHPEDADRVSDLIFESARTLEEFYCEFRVILPGQGLRWRWSQAHPERTADGGTLWHGIISDITERKQTEEALRESEEKFSTFMDTAYDLMSITDKDGRFTYVNESMINKLEYSRGELIGKHITEILPKEAIEKDFQPNWPVFLENGKLNVESKLLTKSGDIIDCTLKAVAIYDKDDNFIGSRAVISDITERKQAEENLKKSEERFRALHNASFGGIAIHDKGVILECNLGLSQISGFSRDELIGADGVGLLIAQESRETVMNNIRSGYEKSYEVFGLRKNGEKYPVRLEARKIPYKDKNVRVVEFRDITEKKKIEHELIKAQEETLLKNKISNAFILADDDEFYNSILDMILETFNCKFGFFGYMDYSDEEKLICPSMTYDIWDECQIPGKSIEFPKSIWAGIWGESLKTKTSIYKNSDLKLPAGHVQLENALAVPIIYKMKLLGQIVVGNNREGFDDSHKEKLEEICNYISPLLDSHLMERKYESELISAKEKAEESNRLKTAFLNNMSHEIRTPINGITGFIEIMQDGELNDAEKKEYFDIINKSSERLIATVTDIVDISKIEAGEVKVSKK
ncbi:MAG: PAS domain S-box protein, partial [Bacteroidota bacterium]